MMNYLQGWSMNKEISLGDILAIIIAISAVIMAYGKLDARISVLEELKIDLTARLDRIEAKLDRMIERKQ